jgi:hypothetical protein
MQTYNGMKVPAHIDPKLIISAFENGIDHDKVTEFAAYMKMDMLGHSFPEIEGFPSIITEGDFGKEFLTGEVVTEEHLDKMVWMVTNGHHRSLAAIEAELPYFPTTLDYNTITTEIDLKNYPN